MTPQEQAEVCLTALPNAISRLPKDHDHMTWAIEFVGRSYDAIEGECFTDKLRIMAMGVPFHREVFDAVLIVTAMVRWLKTGLQPAATPQ